MGKAEVDVTITGADDGDDPAVMAELSREFPFVEWGILQSATRDGVPRYPTTDWMRRLNEVKRVRRDMRLALHFCGRLARAAMRGLVGWEGTPRYFSRMQVNGYEPVAPGESARRAPRELALAAAAEVIFQVRDAADLGAAAHEARVVGFPPVAASLLFDGSGGRGIRPTSWPPPPEGKLRNVRVGYAGGIGPDNAGEVALAVAAFGRPTWIDMETGVRTDDRLDIGKVLRVLQAVAEVRRG